MRVRLTALALVLVAALAACGGDDGDDDVATDPGGSGAGPAAPTAPPAAPGDVRSRNLATVMDKDATDDLVELCLGAVAESYPPQCGGPAITNWDWTAHQGMFDEEGDVRWGTFAVTGTWDGTSFTVSEAIPGALYDPMPEEPPAYPEPSRDYDEGRLGEIAEELTGVPGVLGAYGDPETGHVLVDVVYDDGSYQDYADATYGDGVVVVTGALVDAGR
jgi:hypothetical protein